MKKGLTLILFLLMFSLLLTSCGECDHVDENNDGVCDECGWNYDHEHTYSEEWSCDGENHWRIATCEHSVSEAYKGAHADADNDGACDTCGFDNDHKHEYATAWTSDADNHWHAPTCGHDIEGSYKGAHKDKNNDGACDICSYNGGHVHEYKTEWSTDENEHWHAPSCGHTVPNKDKGLHVDFDNDSICDECAYDFNHVHEYDSAWTYDKNSHWHSVRCDHEVAVSDKAAHLDVNKDGACDECGYDGMIQRPGGEIELPEIEF